MVREIIGIKYYNVARKITISLPKVAVRQIGLNRISSRKINHLSLIAKD